jgi:hypothetical protein
MRITRKDPPDPYADWKREKERLQERLDELGISKCMVCDGGFWEVNGLAAYDLQGPRGMVVDAGQALWVVLVSCQKCGNTLNFKYSTLARD